MGEQMKYFRTYIITVIIGILFIVTLSISTKDDGNTLTNARQIEYNDNWTVISKEGEKFYEKLPLSVKNNADVAITLEKKLPDKIENGDTIAFYMGHNIIHAYVEEELIYTFDVPKVYEKMSKTPGTTWNFINLASEDAGKTLRIELIPVYENTIEHMPDIVYGDRAKIVVEIITRQAVPMMISALLFCVGGAIVLCMIVFKEQLHAPAYMYWLGIFALVTSIWSMLQTQVFTLVYGQNIRGNQISFIVFQLLFIPLISYVKNFCEVEKDRVYDGLCIGSVGILLLTTVLQFAGIQDYRETIWLAYVLYAIGAIWMFVIVKKPLLKKIKKDSRPLKIQCVSLGILVFSIALDMINYLRWETVDAAKFSRVMFLFYIVIQICVVFEDSIKLIHLGEQFEVISKEALHDALTKLSNRNAFEKDLLGYQAKSESGAVMFDLNNLKYFNDVHGHAMGDYYIIVCSEIIQDIFGVYGKVYRIGGDEFCAVVESVDEEKFQELRRNMNDRIEALNGTFFEDQMSVATGYAGFDMAQDKDIHDTVKRADVMMYECKASMKNRRS